MENLAPKDKIIEYERVYIYPNEFRPGEAMLNAFTNIIKIDVQADGSHRIHTADGNIHYVGKGYCSIKALPVENKEEKEDVKT